MSFTDIRFIIFFIVLLIVIFISQKVKYTNNSRFRHFVVLIASYVFYWISDYRFCLLLLLLTIVSYLVSKYMKKHRKISIIIGVVTPLLVLCFCKYTNFFIESFTKFFNIASVSSLNIILPIGISFYTFRSLSYVIDVYRQKLEATSYINTALYISFFPQLVSGPVEKARDFIPQLSNGNKVTLKNIEIGIQIFVMGLFKKLVLADRLSVFVNDVYKTPKAYSSITVILAVIAYSLQIYFDFSGYSDMAIGVAKCIGYDTRFNFNLPYLSKNPTEFWKRWHISLSSWLQEYLYIPLGGNRKGIVRTYINLLLTMMLGGLWHGASFNFVIWGLLNGLALCIHKLFKKYCDIKIPTFVSILLNNIFVSLCWIFFRANNLELAFDILNRIFIWNDGVNQFYTWLLFAIITEIIYVTWCKTKNNALDSYYLHHDLNTIKGLCLFFIEIMVIVGLMYTGGSPFIYFQF